MRFGARSGACRLGSGSCKEGSECLPNCWGSDLELSQLVIWHPCGLQMRFQAYQWPSWVNDDEHDVEFVMWAILVVVEVLGNGDGIATYPYLRANFFTKFARKSVGRSLTGFYVAARQEPPVVALRPDKQDAVPPPDHGPRDHLDCGRSHRDQPYSDRHAPRSTRDASDGQSSCQRRATALSKPPYAVSMSTTTLSPRHISASRLTG